MAIFEFQGAKCNQNRIKKSISKNKPIYFLGLGT